MTFLLIRSQKLKSIMLLIFLLMTCLPAMSHGVSARELDSGRGIEVHYANQSPLAFCGVVIFRPDQPNKPFQKGQTDANGRFLFYPDQPGVWKIKVSDGMGHGIVYKMEITDELNEAAVLKTETEVFNPPHTHSQGVTLSKQKPIDQVIMPRSQKVIIGLAFIFGLTGIGTFAASIREKRSV